MKKNLLFTCIALAGMLLVNFSCRKEIKEDPSEEGKLTAMSGESPLYIDIEDVYAALPQVIMHNIKSGTNKLYVGRSQWKSTPDGILVRIPTSTSNNGYIYATKTFVNPTKTNVFAVKYIPETGSTDSIFTGKEIWIDFQNWTSYGIRYNHNTAISYMQPQILGRPDWEIATTMHGHYYTNSSGLIALQAPGGSGSGGSSPSESTETGMKPTDGPYDCPGEGGSWLGNLFSSIGDFFGGIGNWIGGLFDGGWGDGSSGGGSTPGGGDGNWGGSPSGPGSAGPGGVSNGSGPGYGWTGGGSVGHGPDPGVVEYRVRVNGGVPSDRSTTFDPNRPVQYVVSVLGVHGAEFSWLTAHMVETEKLKRFWLLYYPSLTADQKRELAKEHLKLMMENPDYLTQINNLPGNWWEIDQDGNIAAKKIQLEIYLQANPEGMLDCDELATLPMTMYQEVGSYPVPQTVLTRINTLRNNNSPAYTTSNFRIKGINEASGGVVNCDYFYIKINSLPYLNNVQMTPLQFLEYFRKNMNSFISPSVGVLFQPYNHFVAGSVNINETTKWNSANASSLGSLVHIDMLQDGTVVESGYSINNTTNHHSFTFTTMYTPLDYNHPVAGNRRFGIFQSGGSYYFYILGVDRTNDYATTLSNAAINAAFNGADDLWHSVQDHILDFCDTHQGDAFMAEEKIARLDWDNTPVKQFLSGELTLTQLKAALHCP